MYAYIRCLEKTYSCIILSSEQISMYGERKKTNSVPNWVFHELQALRLSLNTMVSDIFSRQSCNIHDYREELNQHQQTVSNERKVNRQVSVQRKGIFSILASRSWKAKELCYKS